MSAALSSSNLCAALHCTVTKFDYFGRNSSMDANEGILSHKNEIWKVQEKFDMSFETFRKLFA